MSKHVLNTRLSSASSLEAGRWQDCERLARLLSPRALGAARACCEQRLRFERRISARDLRR
jgi:hypothetical protein